MEQDAEQTPPLVATPRHLRRKRFRADISDQLLVPGAHPFQSASKPAAGAKPQRQPTAARRTAYQRKRLVALVAVIAVCLAVPALVAALLLAG